jgi:hypothetical protein
MRDILVLAAVVLGFAALVTAHVVTIVGMARRRSGWRRCVGALIVPVLAPYWAWQGRMRVRSGVWVGSLLVYVVARVAAAR